MVIAIVAIVNQDHLMKKGVAINDQYYRLDIISWQLLRLNFPPDCVAFSRDDTKYAYDVNFLYKR